MFPVLSGSVVQNKWGTGLCGAVREETLRHCFVPYMGSAACAEWALPRGLLSARGAEPQPHKLPLVLPASQSLTLQPA